MSRQTITPQPLGDQAALVYLPDEDAAWRFAEAARASDVPWRLDVVQAYASVAVFFAPGLIAFARVADWLKRRGQAAANAVVPRAHVLPCCYELGPDLGRVAERLG